MQTIADAREKRKYRVCIAQTIVHWFQHQPGKTNSFVRLVKWRLLCDSTEMHIDGRTVSMLRDSKRQGITRFFVELVATHIVGCFSPKEFTMMKGLQKLHSALSNEDTLKVYFKPRNWPAPAQDLAFTAANSPYTQHYINRVIQQWPVVPTVIDPSNPYENVAAHITPLGWKMLRKATKREHLLRQVQTTLLLTR